MTTFLVVIHVLVSLFLIFIVLVQGGKGAELGAAFGGGSSQTLFGSRGAATFLGKMTTIVAIVFMVTSMLLAIASVKGGSLITSTPPAATSPAATAPGAGGLPEGGIPSESQVPLNQEDGSGEGAPAAPAEQQPAGQ